MKILDVQTSTWNSDRCRLCIEAGKSTMTSMW